MHLFLALILILLLFASIILILFSLHLRITPMPTSHKVKKIVLDKFPNLSKGIVADLGAGWGHIVIPLAKRFPHLEVRAYELSLIPYLCLRLLKFFLALPNLKIIRRNFMQVDLSSIDVIYCYLYPGAMEKLRVKFEKKRPTWIISNTFSILGWTPQEIYQVDDLYHTNVYVWLKMG